MTPSVLAWITAGKPPHKYPVYDGNCACAICGGPTGSGAARVVDVDNATISDQSATFRIGTPTICQACAWLFGAGRGKPGNFIAAGDRFEYTVISVESVVEDKRPWLDVLADVARLPDETPVAAVMTTDVKPRLWQRTRMATVERFGLYLHVPDYDVSEFRHFDLGACIDLIDSMLPALRAGFAKASVYHGLLRDYARSAKDPESAIEMERQLAPHRNAPHFLPALIAAGVTQEQKRDVKPTARPTRHIEPAAAVGHPTGETQLGLF